MYRFMQQVYTPRGPGFFVGHFVDGINCMVAMKDHGRQINRIFRNEEITDKKPPRQPSPVHQVADEAPG